MNSLFSKLLIVSVFVFGLAGCVRTNVVGISQANYENQSYPNVAVKFYEDLTDKRLTSEIESALLAQLQSSGINAKLYTEFDGASKFDSDEKALKTSASEGYLTVLFVEMDGSIRSIQKTYTSTGYVSSPIRNTAITLKLVDSKNVATIWDGTASTLATGVWDMDNESTVEDLTEEVVEELVATGHL